MLVACCRATSSTSSGSPIARTTRRREPCSTDVIAEIAPGTPIWDVDATDPDVAQEVRFPGSPTIRVDGRDVDPTFVDPGEYTLRCRVFWTTDGLRGVPAREWIEAALRG